MTENRRAAAASDRPDPPFSEQIDALTTAAGTERPGTAHAERTPERIYMASVTLLVTLVLTGAVAVGSARLFLGGVLQLMERASVDARQPAAGAEQ